MKRIFLTILFLFLALPLSSSASSLSFLPQNPEYDISETFITDLYINTEGEQINAIQLKINFDSDLEVVDIMTGESIIDLWTKSMPKVSNEENYIELSGGILNGYNGKGNLLKIIFKSNEIGEHNIGFSDDALILLNDGKATEVKNITLIKNSINITERQQPEGSIEIISPNNPDPDTWSNNNDLKLSWEMEEGVEYSYILSKDPLVEPDDEPDKPEGDLEWMGNMSYKELEDGVYYFHLKKREEGGTWSETTTIRVMIDISSPKEFEIQITDIEGKKYLIFKAEDEISGIDHYEISENKLDLYKNGYATENWTNTESPYMIQDQNNDTLIRIKAIDKAGNETISEITLTSEKNNSTTNTLDTRYYFLLLLLILTAIILTTKKVFKK